MRKFLFILPLLALLFSCRSHENLAYFSVNTPQLNQVISNTDWQLKIVPDDKLSIYVTSDIPEATALYNLPDTTYTYIVNKEGNINFPKLGKLHVEGLTTTQLAEELTRRIAVDVEAPYVRVELLNFKVNVLGEVAKPGITTADSERFTILDALAQAGDITVFGKRENVTLLREEDGRITYHQVDMNDANLIKSPYYYLQQNDVIYVEPNVARRGQAEYNQNNSFKISVVSTIVSGASVIASLIIALTAKR
ncbi:MAG: polysaccharide export protein [Muribaculaceae bacterium]|nr:polysaccharide export protein [Muribaculaceae bacterium]